MEHKPIVLVVDDEIQNVEILQYLLKDMYSVVVAMSGVDCLIKLRTLVPSVILSDLMMPGIDGYQLCKQIKADSRFRWTKVILVSGKGRIEERIKGYEVGADDYVLKPFDHEELKAKLKVFLDLSLTQQKLQATNEFLESEVKYRTELLLKAERMAYLGMHSAEIVHNLKNPISIIQGSAQRLQRSYPEELLVTKILAGCQRLVAIVHTIMSSSRTDSPVTQVEVNLNAILQNEINLMNMDDSCKNSVTFEVGFGEISTIRGVEIHFSQVFSNLLRNALDAMFESEKRILRVSSTQSGDEVSVAISDTGSGIDPANLEKVFEPHFTTKRRDSSTEIDSKSSPTGTGLGLPFCKKMVEGYGGRISIASIVGEGTTMTVTLPCSSEQKVGSPSLNGTGNSAILKVAA